MEKRKKQNPASYVLLAKPAKNLAKFDADEDEEEEELVGYYINAHLHTMIADASASIRLK